jgi:uncharacterized cupin superfamily protein
METVVRQPGEAPPGFPGPPPHRHREIVDVFYVLEGELTLEIEGKAIAAQPGTLVDA